MVNEQPADEVLLDKFRGGDEQACHVLYDRFYRPICYFSESIVGNINQAEDIASECFTKLWSLRENIGSMAQAKSFLYTAARNASLNYLKALRVRSQSQHELVRASESSADQDHFMAKMIKAQLLKYVYDEMEKLPPKLQTIFKLIYVEGLTTKEISTQLGMQEQSVRNAKGKALAMLRYTLTKSKVLIAVVVFLRAIVK